MLFVLFLARADKFVVLFLARADKFAYGMDKLILKIGLVTCIVGSCLIDSLSATLHHDLDKGCVNVFDKYFLI